MNISKWTSTHTRICTALDPMNLLRERQAETERDRERGYSNAPSLSLMALLQIQGRWSWRIVIFEFDYFFQVNLRLSNRSVYKSPDCAQHTERKWGSVAWQL